MKLRLYQVDAFAARPFEGNPAAVVPLEEWLPDGLMQSIALENNLDLVSARMDPEIAQLGVDIERATFDPALGAGSDVHGVRAFFEIDGKHGRGHRRPDAGRR